jgi:hypothetical protein
MNKAMLTLAALVAFGPSQALTASCTGHRFEELASVSITITL